MLALETCFEYVKQDTPETCESVIGVHYSTNVGIWSLSFVIRETVTELSSKLEKLRAYIESSDNAVKMKFCITNLFSKYDQIYPKLQIWPHLLKKSLMGDFIFCAVRVIKYCYKAHNCQICSTNTKTFFWISEVNLETFQKLFPCVRVTFNLCLEFAKSLNQIFWLTEYCTKL